MKVEITIDETILKDVFEGTIGDPESLHRANRFHRHLLVGSKELLAVWRKLEEGNQFRTPLARLQFQNWMTMAIQKPNSLLRMVKADLSLVQGEPTEDQCAVLGTAYLSKDKVIVGDYPEALRTANSELIFVSRGTFSKVKANVTTWDQVERVISQTTNFKEDFFDVFETPVVLEVPQDSDTQLLADYLARFYDDKLVIQDYYFVESDENERNFDTYVLPKLSSSCQVTVRSNINRSLQVKGNDKRTKYAGMTGYAITLEYIERRRENLHDGYFETSKYRVTNPYRLGIFGTNGKNRKCTIHIFPKP